MIGADSSTINTNWVQNFFRQKSSEVLVLVFLFITCEIATFSRIVDFNFNNVLIFGSAYSHLTNPKKNMYRLQLIDHQDIYKYGPTAAVLLAPLNWIDAPTAAGLWTLLNFMVLIWALICLFPGGRDLTLVLLFIAPELIGSLQNFQSNALLLGLFIFAFLNSEKSRSTTAGFLIALTAHLKIFGLAMGVLGLKNDRRKLSFAFWCVFWTALLIALPLLFVPKERLSSVYYYWFKRLRDDSSVSDGLCFTGVFRAFTGIRLNDFLVTLVSGVFLSLPLALIRKADFRFGKLALSSTLIWMVVFNHKSESATFIFAMVGAALWYIYSQSHYRKPIIWACLFFASGLYSDLIPNDFKHNYIEMYKLKVWPFIYLWIVLQWEIWIAAAKSIVPPQQY